MPCRAKKSAFNIAFLLNKVIRRYTIVRISTIHASGFGGFAGPQLAGKVGFVTAGFRSRGIWQTSMVGVSQAALTRGFTILLALNYIYVIEIHLLLETSFSVISNL